MMRVVLDTNILLMSLSRKTIYHAIWKAFQNGEFELCVTTDILNEYAEILQRKFRPEVGISVMKAIENSFDVIQVQKYFFLEFDYR